MEDTELSFVMNYSRPSLLFVGYKRNMAGEQSRVSENEGKKFVEKYKEKMGGEISVFWGGELSAKTGHGVIECIKKSVQRYIETCEGCPICKSDAKL